MRRKSGLAIFLCGLFLVSASLAPQEKKKELSHSITVRAITMAVTVVDRRGRFVDNLTQKDFELYEDGERREIVFFNHDAGSPLSLTVLLDVSGSMAVLDKYNEARAALRELAASVLAPGDEIALLIFADGDVEVAAPFSTDKTRFLNELDRTEPYGQTALYDAVAVSPAFANRGRNEKRAVLLVTDGVENDSRLTPAAAIEAARRVEVPLYAVGYKIPRSEVFLRKLKRAADLTPAGIIGTLTRFAQATGGKAFFLDEPAALRAALLDVRKELGHQYLVGFTSHADPDAGFKKIRVATVDKRYRVRTREGF
jgi:VWFA-related protein